MSRRRTDRTVAAGVLALLWLAGVAPRAPAEPPEADQLLLEQVAKAWKNRQERVRTGQFRWTERRTELSPGPDRVRLGVHGSRDAAHATGIHGVQAHDARGALLAVRRTGGDVEEHRRRRQALHRTHEQAEAGHVESPLFPGPGARV